MPIGAVWGRFLLNGPCRFSRCETQPRRVDIREPLFLDRLTEDPVAKGIDTVVSVPRKQTPNPSATVREYAPKARAHCSY